MYNPMLALDEVFKDICIPDILPVYQISNYGTVINKTTGHQISQHYTEDGYCRVSLRSIYGTSILFLVHRLVMMTFHPIENPELFEVNHIYGIKNDNRDIMLEWTTGEENRLHAQRMNLNKNYAENHSKAVFTNDQVRIICEGLSRGRSFDEIQSEIGYTNCKDFRRSVEGILDGKVWKSISKDYVFAEYPNRRNMFTDEQAHLICKMLSSGAGYKDIAIALGYDINKMDSKELSDFSDNISNIRTGRYYSNISSQYSFDNSKSRYDQKLSNDDIELVCKLLESGKSTKDILYTLGYTKKNTSSKEYDSLSHFISRIRNRRQFTSISSKYNF